MNTYQNNSSLARSLSSAQDTVQTLLIGLAAEDSSRILSLAFGDSYDTSVFYGFQQQWLSSDFELSIQLLSGSQLNGANGAFSVDTNSIYLSTDFLASGSPDAIASVLLEEYAHYLDSQLNTEDSHGDEGAIFSALVRGEELTATDLALLKAEDDSAEITVDGITIDVEQQVIGTDDGRELVTNTTDFPWSTIGWISSEWDRQGQSGSVSGGTGSVFLSPYHVLTAAHVVWDKAEQEASGNGYAGSVTVNFGQSGQERYYGTARVTDMMTFNGWTNDSNWTLTSGGEWVPDSRSGDLALLTLDRNIGDRVGYFGYDTDVDDSLNVNIAGYPADLANSWTWEHGYSVSAEDAPDVDLYKDFGGIDEVVGGILRYEIDTAGGQSGSPVWRYDDETDNRYMVGVHVAGTSSYNSAVRLTEGKINAIKNKIDSSTPPEDLPDFVDYDYWMGTDFSYFQNGETNASSGFRSYMTISAGDDFTVRSVVRNIGTEASDSLAPQVSFYASVDTNISSLDYFLGEVTLSEIAPFDWEDAIYRGAFPNLPQGDYYIGWEIDSSDRVDEFRELNNDGLLADFVLTVD